MYVPNDYQRTTAKTKNILLYDGSSVWGDLSTEAIFNKCPVSQCAATYEVKEANTSDAIIFTMYSVKNEHVRPSKQLWILYLLECPSYTPSFKSLANLINWTATYRSDSDIVAPYAKWVYYDDQVKEKLQKENYAANKSMKVAWFVSNCNTKNNRLKYAQELSKYVPVDIYGSCGNLFCLKSDPKCFELLKTYKFYLSFENSNCRDYITEKLYQNALRQDIVPIVMGAPKENYVKSVPRDSFIHVDDYESPKELANYLYTLHKNDNLYNKFFKWKGTGEFINTYFWCRLCTLLHSPFPTKFYKDVNEWWGRPGICTYKEWKNVSIV
ncbi:hypothetical protein FQA39_LY03837 [Lamprigera yunnana]|nr:hypothetical protein FQA39_LY03837 [Lamprigera yunnana]